MEGGGDLPRLVDFLSKSAIFASFIEQNRPIPTTGSSAFSPAFAGFFKGFTSLKSPTVRKTVRRNPAGRPSSTLLVSAPSQD